MSARVLLPDLADVNNAYAAVIRANLPDGVRRLIVMAAMAAMMSTASAGLLAASSTLSEDILPYLRRGSASSVRITHLRTALCGLLMLGIALVVTDAPEALMLAYNLLVGGILIPLIGAIFWKHATGTAAATSMIAGCSAAAITMVVDGIDANPPIYYDLALGLVAYVLGGVATRRAPVRS